MKNSTILFTLLSVITATTYAQQNKTVNLNVNSEVNLCDALKKENDSLKKALGLNEPILFYKSNEIEYQLIKVVGDKKNQMVTLELLVTNKIENRNFEIQNVMGTAIKITTINGDVLLSNDMIIPGAAPYSSITTLHTDTPIKMTFKFNPLLPNNEYIKFSI